MDPLNRSGVGRARGGARADVAALLPALALWSALLWLPRALDRWMAAPVAHGLGLGGVLLALLATRTRAPGGAARALVVAALALAAGGLVAPWAVRGLVRLGVWLGLPVAAPRPPLVASCAPLGPCLAAGLAALALGPCVEELLYRERLLGALRQRGAGLAIGASTLLFALAHPDPWQRLAAASLGLALGVAMWRTGSLALCIGLHAGLNAGVLLGGVPRSRGPGPAWGVAGALLLAGAMRLTRSRGARGAAVAALAVGVALPVGAGVRAFEGSLRFAPLHPSMPPPALDGVGVATVNGSGGGIALETLALAGGIGGGAVVPVTDPLVSNGGIVALSLSAALGSGTLRPLHPPAPWTQGQLTAATLSVSGAVRLCLLVPDCSLPFGLPLRTTATSAGVGVGVGGLVTAYPLSTVMLSLFGAPWTLRTASLPVTTSAGASFFAVAAGSAHGPASFTGSTAVTGGVLRLVSPVRIDATGGGGPPSGFAHLEVRLLPEPRSLLLLGPGLACLALAVRLRRA